MRIPVSAIRIGGDVRDAARLLVRKAVVTLDEMTPVERRCLLLGGETTVVVRGTGTSGRNQELALAFALETAGVSGITLLSGGTDGSTDAAGAMDDGSVAPAARKLGIHPEVHLGNNDSCTFFQRFDARSSGQHHLMAGPTGTNVLDLQTVLVEKL